MFTWTDLLLLAFILLIMFGLPPYTKPPAK